jgi:hypothetical protein
MKLSTLRIPCAPLSSALSLVAIAGLLVPGAPLASAQDFSHAAIKIAKPIKQTHVLNPSSVPRGLRQARSLSAQAVPVKTSLTPVNTGTGIVFTCDPNVAAATCSYLNSAVAANLNGTFTNANANIYVQYGATGLGSTTQYQNFITYDQYVGALNANTNKSAIQKSALSALSTYDAGPYGASNIEVTSALGTNLGFTGMLGIKVNSDACTPGTAACYNALVTVTNDPNVPLYYDNLGGTEPADAYDFYEVVAHEANEVLGTASCISTSGGISNGCGTGTASAVDLFRYSNPGDLVLDSTLSAVPGAYFSYNGGSTNGANGRAGTPKFYSTVANGNDYADFLSSEPDCGTNAAVQDAEACPGGSQGLSILNDGGGEIHILSAVGYDTPPVVTASNFTITASPSSETVVRERLGAVILTLKSVQGFNASVTLSCTGGPAGTKCANFPMKVNVHGTAYAVSGVVFPKNTSAGSYNVTFTGVSGSLRNSTTVKFTIK